MESSEFNTDIFYKAGKQSDYEPASDVFNISPLLFKGTDHSLSDLTDTHKINSRLINVHRVLLDSEYMPELSNNQSVQIGAGFSATSDDNENFSVSDTSSFYPKQTTESVSSFSIPLNRTESNSISASSFSYTTESGLTTPLSQKSSSSFNLSSSTRRSISKLSESENNNPEDKSY